MSSELPPAELAPAHGRPVILDPSLRRGRWPTGAEPVTGARKILVTGAPGQAVPRDRLCLEASRAPMLVVAVAAACERWGACE